MDSEKKISLLIVAGGACLGGAEVALLDLVRSLTGKEVFSTVVCKHGSYLEKKLTAMKGTETLALKIPSWRKFLERLQFSRFVKEVRRRLGDREIDVVLSNDFWTAPHAIGISRRLGCKALTLVQDSVLDERKARQYLLGDFERILTVSEFMRHRLDSIIGDSMVINVGGGIDVDKFSPTVSGVALRNELGIGASDFVLMSIGRICENKGQRYLARALMDQLKTTPNWWLVFVGFSETSDGEEIRDLAIRHSVSDRVVFAGLREEVSECVAGCDLLIQLSRRESFGLAVAEAMAMEKPVIYRDIPAMRELCPDGETGVAIQEGAEGELVGAALDFYRNPERRAVMGARGRERILNKYPLEGKAEGILNIVKESMSA